MHRAVAAFTSEEATAYVRGSTLRAASRSSYPTIATVNLRLRPFGLTDISALVATANSHHVTDTALDTPCPFTAKYAQQWINSHAAAWEARDSVHWAVSELADDRFVGYLCLHNIDLDERQAELNFWMGQGIDRVRHATEATQAALAFAFATLQLDRVHAFHLTRNHLATRVLARLGMQQVGPMDQLACGSDQYENVIVRGISRSAWLDSL
jgi:RimJ/RimL family protein N-acetyltransferase